MANLVRNGDFESGTLTPYWTAGSAGTYITNYGLTGNYACEAGWSSLSQDFASPVAVNDLKAFKFYALYINDDHDPKTYEVLVTYHFDDILGDLGQNINIDNSGPNLNDYVLADVLTNLQDAAGGRTLTGFTINSDGKCFLFIDDVYVATETLKYPLYISVNDSNGGTVDPSGYVFPDMWTVVEINVSTNEGYVFAGWQTNEGTYKNENPFYVLSDASRRCIAIFYPLSPPPTLPVISDDDGAGFWTWDDYNGYENDSIDKIHGSDSLKITFGKYGELDFWYDYVDAGYGVQDWSYGDSISFWFKGVGTHSIIGVYLYTTIADTYTSIAAFYDDSDQWQLITINKDDFICDNWEDDIPSTDWSQISAFGIYCGGYFTNYDSNFQTGDVIHFDYFVLNGVGPEFNIPITYDAKDATPSTIIGHSTKSYAISTMPNNDLILLGIGLTTGGAQPKIFSVSSNNQASTVLNYTVEEENSVVIAVVACGHETIDGFYCSDEGMGWTKRNEWNNEEVDLGINWNTIAGQYVISISPTTSDADVSIVVYVFPAGTGVYEYDLSWGEPYNKTIMVLPEGQWLSPSEWIKYDYYIYGVCGGIGAIDGIFTQGPPIPKPTIGGGGANVIEEEHVRPAEETFSTLSPEQQKTFLERLRQLEGQNKKRLEAEEK